MKIKYSQFLILILVFFTLKSYSQQAKSYSYEPDTSVITGVMEEKIFYGPPGYGEDPTTDSKETEYILVLTSPIDAIQKNKSDELDVTEKNITEVQLVVLSNAVKKRIGDYVNKKVIVKGQLFHSITGHHHTTVLITVNEIKLE